MRHHNDYSQVAAERKDKFAKQMNVEIEFVLMIRIKYLKQRLEPYGYFKNEDEIFRIPPKTIPMCSHQGIHIDVTGRLSG